MLRHEGGRWGDDTTLGGAAFLEAEKLGAMTAQFSRDQYPATIWPGMQQDL